MLSIILSAFWIIAYAFFCINLFCAANMSIHPLLEWFALYTAGLVLPTFFIISFWILIADFITKCKHWQKKRYDVTEVEAVVTKREHKKNRYKVTVTYEDLTVTLNNSTLYHVCREGESVRMKLFTHNCKRRILSVD